jgi:hypothetical protein
MRTFNCLLSDASRRARLKKKLLQRVAASPLFDAGDDGSWGCPLTRIVSGHYFSLAPPESKRQTFFRVRLSNGEDGGVYVSRFRHATLAMPASPLEHRARRTSHSRLDLQAEPRRLACAICASPRATTARLARRCQRRLGRTGLCASRIAHARRSGARRSAAMDKRLAKCQREARRDWPQGLGPMRQREREFVRQWRRDAAPFGSSAKSRTVKTRSSSMSSRKLSTCARTGLQGIERERSRLR